MKKILTLLILGIMTLAYGEVVTAGTYVYSPSDSNLGDLDHYSAYYWGIDVTNGGQYSFNPNEITGASLVFNDIRNHDDNWNILRVSAMDDFYDFVGVYSTYDNQNTSDYFSDSYFNADLLFTIEGMNNWGDDADDDDVPGRDILVNLSNEDSQSTAAANGISSYVDSNGQTVTNVAVLTMEENALSNLIKWVSTEDGIFTLGFDPDCHFFNSGISLVLTTGPEPTSTVPEPKTLLLFGIGLIGFSAFGRKKLHMGNNNA